MTCPPQLRRRIAIPAPLPTAVRRTSVGGWGAPRHYTSSYERLPAHAALSAQVTVIGPYSYAGHLLKASAGEFASATRCTIGHCGCKGDKTSATHTSKAGIDSGTTQYRRLAVFIIVATAVFPHVPFCPKFAATIYGDSCHVRLDIDIDVGIDVGIHIPWHPCPY